MWKFGRKRAKVPVAIATLPVPMSAWIDDGPYALPQAVVDIVNQLTGPGQYLREELPIEAFWSYHTDYYLAQVNNGGHGQFAHNSGWNDAVNADIRNGLGAMMLSNAEEIFSEFERFARDEVTRFTVARKGGGFGDKDPLIADLDARFFQTVSKAIPPAHNAWLRTLPVLVPVSDAELPARLNELITANPLRAERQAECERLLAAAQARDPLVQAFKLMLAHAKPPLTYLRA